jgi:hypothetical protein
MSISWDHIYNVDQHFTTSKWSISGWFYSCSTTDLVIFCK